MPPSENEEMLANVVETLRTRFYGKYRGVVADVNDPENMGRITARVPEIYQEEISPWALPAVPFAGSQHGLVLIPEVGDGVWIEFEAGDLSRPIWTGGWWGSGELPDPGGPRKRVLVTSPGHKLIVDDEDDEIHLLHSGGAEIKMTADDITLTIGQAEVKLSADQISLKIGASEITLTSTDLTLKGGPAAQVKLSAAGVDVNSGAVKVM